MMSCYSTLKKVPFFAASSKGGPREDALCEQWRDISLEEDALCAISVAWRDIPLLILSHVQVEFKTVALRAAESCVKASRS